jgi:hypothetical protein
MLFIYVLSLHGKIVDLSSDMDYIVEKASIHPNGEIEIWQDKTRIQHIDVKEKTILAMYQEISNSLELMLPSAHA